MDLEDISAYESREMRMKLCVYCIEARGLREATEDQPWNCSVCNTPLVGEMIHLQRCFSPEECVYEHMHHTCYNEVAETLLQ